jgi:hypothetical protein
VSEGAGPTGADLEGLLQLMPFATTLGIELDAADPARPA